MRASKSVHVIVWKAATSTDFDRYLVWSEIHASHRSEILVCYRRSSNMQRSKSVLVIVWKAATSTKIARCLLRSEIVLVAAFWMMTKIDFERCMFAIGSLDCDHGWYDRDDGFPAMPIVLQPLVRHHFVRS